MREQAGFRGKAGEGLPPWAAGAIVLGVLGAAALVGRRNAPDRSHPGIRRWYHKLRKPGFTPPDPVFGAVWPILETIHGYGGYRVLRAPSSPQRNAAAALWLATSGMIGGWTQLFFKEHRLATSFGAASAMFAGSVGYVAAAGSFDRKAALAGAPLTAWLGFATVLSEEVWRKNTADVRAGR